MTSPEEQENFAAEPPVRPRKAAPFANDTRLAVAVSLLSSFDFRLVGSVTQADWQRGTKLLRLPDDDDALWSRLQKEYATSEEDGGILLEDLPGRTRDVGVAMDASLLSNVLKGLIGGLAAVTEAADALRDLPSRVEEAEARSNQLQVVVDGLRSKLRASTDVQRRRMTLDAFHDVCSPVFAAWQAQASAQRRLRREMAMRAIAPGVSRCFHFWAEVTEAAAREMERLPALMLQIRRSAARRAVARSIERWRESSQRWKRGAMALMHAYGRSLAAALTHWRQIADELWTARQLREGRRRAAEQPPPPPAPAVRAPSPPPLRACATGWHQDLALYGTALSHRDEAIERVRQLRESEKGRVGELETRLAFAEARASVLERRLALRERILLRDDHNVYQGGVAVGALSPEQYELLAAASSQNQPQRAPPHAPPYAPAPPPPRPAQVVAPVGVMTAASGAPTPSYPVRPASAAAAAAAAAKDSDAHAAGKETEGLESGGPQVVTSEVGTSEVETAVDSHVETQTAWSSPPPPPTSITSNAPWAAPAQPMQAQGEVAAVPGAVSHNEQRSEGTLQQQTTTTTQPSQSPQPRPPSTSRPHTRPKSASAAMAARSNRAHPSQARQGQTPIYQHLCSNPIVTSPSIKAGGGGGGGGSGGRPRPASPVPIVTTASHPRMLSASLPATPHRKAPQRPVAAKVDLSAIQGLLSLEPGQPGPAFNVGMPLAGRAGMRTPGRRAGY